MASAKAAAACGSPGPLYRNPKVAFWRDERVRGLIAQIMVVIALRVRPLLS